MAFHYFNKGSPAIGRLAEPFINLANTLGDHASSPFADERISGEKRLTIGIGGDVPVYPPLLIAELVMVAFVLKRLYGRWPLSTGMLSLPPIRTGAAFAAFAWVDKTRRECAFYMEQLGNGADYEPLRGLVTDGPYAELRHPFYRALCLVLPAISLTFNSAWMCAPSRTIGASGYSLCARVVWVAGSSWRPSSRSTCISWWSPTRRRCCPRPTAPRTRTITAPSAAGSEPSEAAPPRNAVLASNGHVRPSSVGSSVRPQAQGAAMENRVTRGRRLRTDAARIRTVW